MASRDELSPPPTKRRRRDSSTKRDDNGDNLVIYSWNINGIAPFLQPTITSFFRGVGNIKQDERCLDRASLRSVLAKYDWPHMLLLQEVKINGKDTSTMRAVERAVKQQLTDESSTESHDYEAHFCLPSDKYNARGFGGKVYGVCSIIRKDFRDRFVEAIRTVPWDQEGRFLVIETKAHRNVPKLAVINIYAVNGTDHPYCDPETGEVVGTRHDRKLEVHRRLYQETRELEERGFRVVLAGDMNIARAQIDGFPNLRTFPSQHCFNRADFEARFLARRIETNVSCDDDDNNDDACGPKDDFPASLGMIDTFRRLHPDKKGYTYYPRNRAFGSSCDRVDMILTSASLGDHLVDAGMHETPADRGPSDHVPLYATFLFGSTIKTESTVDPT